MLSSFCIDFMHLTVHFFLLIKGNRAQREAKVDLVNFLT